MRKQFSFFVFTNKDSLLRQTTVSGSFVALLTGIIAFCFILFGFAAYDYYNLKKTLKNTRALEDRVSIQADRIACQNKQIQNLADKINTLKSKLVVLDSFEKKVRIIANIEKSAEQDSLFGVGGSISETLDSQIPLTQNHNGLLREMHEQVESLDLASINQEKRFESLYKHLENQRNLLACTPSIRPTKGWVSSSFGYRTSPFTGRREFHKGMDIATKKGTPIIATANGVVAYAGTKGLLGKVVIIDHGHGVVTRYGHLSKALKKRGEKIKRGDTIALVGNTGRSTGPHLHYEVRLNGIPVNPKKYILN